MKPLLSETAGTFILVFTLGFSGQPLTAGFMLAVCVYLGGSLSGGHFNPAVSLAFWSAGRLDSRWASLYIAGQLVGALMAAGALHGLSGSTLQIAPGPSAIPLPAAGIELLGAGLLAFVYLVSDSTGSGSPVYRRAVMTGIAYTALLGITGPIGDSHMNPAAYAAFAVTEFTIYHEAALYLGGWILAPMLGGLASGILGKQMIPPKISGPGEA